MTPEEYEFEYLVEQELEAMRTGRPVRREASKKWLAAAQERLREAREREQADAIPVDPAEVFGKGV